MKNLFLKWHSGRNFSDADSKLSSLHGTLSYKGIPVAFTYFSNVVGQRYIIATKQGAEMIRMKRAITIVSDAALREILDANYATYHNFNSLLIANGSPPIHLLPSTMEAMSRGIGINLDTLAEVQEAIKWFLDKKRQRYLIIMKLPEEYVKEMMHARIWHSDRKLWCTTNSAEELSLISMACVNDYRILDSQKLIKVAKTIFINKKASVD